MTTRGENENEKPKPPQTLLRLHLRFGHLWPKFENITKCDVRCGRRRCDSQLIPINSLVYSKKVEGIGFKSVPVFQGSDQKVAVPATTRTITRREWNWCCSRSLARFGVPATVIAERILAVVAKLPGKTERFTKQVLKGLYRYIRDRINWTLKNRLNDIPVDPDIASDLGVKPFEF